LEFDRTTTIERAKEAVARCSVTTADHVETTKLGKTKKTVGEIIDAASKLNSKEYNFVTYNCRHFVLALLK
jgi:hypothetical protein